MTAARIIIPDCIYLLYFSHGTSSIMQASCQTARRPVSDCFVLPTTQDPLLTPTSIPMPVPVPTAAQPLLIHVVALSPVCPFCCLSEMHKNQIIFLFFICFTLLHLPRTVSAQTALFFSFPPSSSSLLFSTLICIYKYIYFAVDCRLPATVSGLPSAPTASQHSKC